MGKRRQAMEVQEIVQEGEAVDGMRLGLVLHENGRAVKIAAQLLASAKGRKNKKYWRAYAEVHYMAWHHMHGGQRYLERAAEGWEQFIEKGEEEELIDFATVRISIGDYSGAIKLLGKYLKKGQKKRKSAVLRVAMLYSHTGYQAEAISLLFRLVSAGGVPDMSNTHLLFILAHSYSVWSYALSSDPKAADEALATSQKMFKKLFRSLCSRTSCDTIGAHHSHQQQRSTTISWKEVESWLNDPATWRTVADMCSFAQLHLFAAELLEEGAKRCFTKPSISGRSRAHFWFRLAKSNRLSGKPDLALEALDCASTFLQESSETNIDHTKDLKRINALRSCLQDTKNTDDALPLAQLIKKLKTNCTEQDLAATTIAARVRGLLQRKSKPPRSKSTTYTKSKQKKTSRKHARNIVKDDVLTPTTVKCVNHQVQTALASTQTTFTEAEPCAPAPNISCAPAPSTSCAPAPNTLKLSSTPDCSPVPNCIPMESIAPHTAELVPPPALMEASPPHTLVGLSPNDRDLTKKLEEQISLLTAQNSEYTTKVEALESQLQSQQAQIDGHSSESSQKTKATIENLKREVQEIQGKYLIASSENIESTAKINELEKQLREKEERIVLLSSDSSQTVNTKIEALEKQLEESKKNYSLSLAEHTESTTKIEELLKVLQEKERTVALLTSENDRASKAQIEDLEKQLQQSQHKFSTASSQNVDSAAKIEELVQKLQECQEKNVLLSSENMQQASMAKIENLEAQLQESQNNILVISAQNGELTAQIENSKRQLQESHGKFSAENLEFAAKIEALQKQLQDSEVKYSMSSLENAQSAAKVNEIAQKLQDSQERNGLLSSDKIQAEVKIEELEKHLQESQDLSSKYLSKYSEADSELKDLKRKLQEKEDKFVLLSADIHQANSRIEELDKALRDSQDREVHLHKDAAENERILATHLSRAAHDGKYIMDIENKLEQMTNEKDSVILELQTRLRKIDQARAEEAQKKSDMSIVKLEEAVQRLARGVSINSIQAAITDAIESAQNDDPYNPKPFASQSEVIYSTPSEITWLPPKFEHEKPSFIDAELSKHKQRGQSPTRKEYLTRWRQVRAKSPDSVDAKPSMFSIRKSQSAKTKNKLAHATYLSHILNDELPSKASIFEREAVERGVRRAQRDIRSARKAHTCTDYYSTHNASKYRTVYSPDRTKRYYQQQRKEMLDTAYNFSFSASTLQLRPSTSSSMQVS